jgi:hypothetical protein
MSGIPTNASAVAVTLVALGTCGCHGQAADASANTGVWVASAPGFLSGNTAEASKSAAAIQDPNKMPIIRIDSKGCYILAETGLQQGRVTISRNALVFSPQRCFGLTTSDIPTIPPKDRADIEQMIEGCFDTFSALADKSSFTLPAHFAPPLSISEPSPNGYVFHRLDEGANLVAETVSDQERPLVGLWQGLVSSRPIPNGTYSDKLQQGTVDAGSFRNAIALLKDNTFRMSPGVTGKWMLNGKTLTLLLKGTDSSSGTPVFAEVSEDSKTLFLQGSNGSRWEVRKVEF